MTVRFGESCAVLALGFADLLAAASCVAATPDLDLEEWNQFKYYTKPQATVPFTPQVPIPRESALTLTREQFIEK